MTVQQLVVGMAAFVAVLVAGMLSRRAAARPAADVPESAVRDPLVPAWLERSLGAAGIDGAAERRRFAVILATAGSAGAAVGGIGAWLLDLHRSPGVLLALVAGSAFLAVRIPLGWLGSRIAARRMEILTNFTVMLDLLHLAVEGGMGLAAAWATVTDSIGRRGGALASEMRRIDVQVGLGASWPAALRDASARTGVPEFGALGALLGQAERFGTEVGRAIRVQGDALRHEEVESIEERAHQASVRVVFPLVGVFLPALLIVTLIPLLIIVVEALTTVSTD